MAKKETMETRPSTGRRVSALRRRETVAALLFISPWIIGFLVFTLGPMLASLYLSLTNYDVLNAPRYVGLDNYARLLDDPKVRKSLYNSFFYTALHVPLAIILSLGLAMLLNSVKRVAGFFRTVFYLP
ncbi:MAG: sugar ABC transporter permease, partial [Anaerolineaceae bacterium]